MNILYISTHPAPYRDPFLNELSSYKDINLKVYNLFEFDKGHSFWKLPNATYYSKFIGKSIRLGKRRRFHFNILHILKHDPFDYIVTPDFLHYTTIFIVLYCILFHKEYILTFDTVESKHANRIFGLRKWFYSKAFAFFVPGEASKSYLLQYDINPRKILFGAYALDNDRLKQDIQKQEKEKIREELSIPIERTIFLMVANMTPKRDYPLLFEAFCKVQQTNKNIHLLVVGNGVDRDKVDYICEKRNINYTIIDSASFFELTKFYSIADWYIHTGKEPYSTAIAIAAIAGVPVISSYAVGACHDFLLPNISGYVVSDNKSINDWIASMDLAIKNKSKKQMEVEIEKLANNNKVVDFVLKFVSIITPKI